MMRKSLATALSLMGCAAAQAASAVGELDGYVLIEDEEGNPLFAADASGQELTFVYDDQGQVVATIDQAGVLTDWQRLFEEAAGGSQ